MYSSFGCWCFLIWNLCAFREDGDVWLYFWRPWHSQTSTPTCCFLGFWLFFCLQFQGVVVCGCIYWWPWHSQTSTPACCFLGFWLFFVCNFRGWLCACICWWPWHWPTKTLVGLTCPLTPTKLCARFYKALSIDCKTWSTDCWTLHTDYKTSSAFQNIYQSITELLLRMPEKPNY